MSVVSILKFLEMARDYRERYPDLMIGYAVGLTVIQDRDVAERYAAQLETHDVFEGYPGGEISDNGYDAIRSHYQRMHENLKAVQGHGLDPHDSEALSRTIERLKRLLH